MGYARKTLLLPAFSISELEDDGPRVGRDFVRELTKLGMVWVDAPESEAVSAIGLEHGVRFLRSDVEVKVAADGRKHFAFPVESRTDKLAVLDSEIEVDKAAFLAGERGWVRRGTSPSGADKEYFQWGTVSGANVGSLSSLKRNIWPDDKAFVDAKINQLQFHSWLHRMLHSFLCSLFDRASTDCVKKKGFEVICRDTRYFGGVAPSVSAIGASDRKVINPPHVDLANATLLQNTEDLQVYVGRETGSYAIAADEANWYCLDRRGTPPTAFLYIVGLATEIETLGALRAVWHRVARPWDSGERFSTVSFFNAGVDDEFAGGPDIKRDGREYPRIPRRALPVIGSSRYWNAIQANVATGSSPSERPKRSFA